MLVMDLQSNRERVLGWLELGKREGLTFPQLAARSGLNCKVLQRWSTKFLAELAQSKASQSPGKPPAFVELVEQRPSAAGRIEIVLAGERRIVLSGEIDEAALSRVVRALERC